MRPDFLDDRAEGGRIVDSHVGQHLAIDVDLCLLQPGHELAVGDAEATSGSVDARDPELAKHAFLGAAIAIGVLPSAHDRLLGDTKDILAATAKALGERENLFMTCTGSD